MSGMDRRLGRLEDLQAVGGTGETEHERLERLRMIHEDAVEANGSRLRDGREPIFEIADGAVFSVRDGRPVTEAHQVFAEDWYWWHLEELGFEGLVHDEEAQAFYAPTGELALSRDRVDLQHLMRR